MIGREAVTASYGLAPLPCRCGTGGGKTRASNGRRRRRSARATPCGRRSAARRPRNYDPARTAQQSRDAFAESRVDVHVDEGEIRPINSPDRCLECEVDALEVFERDASVPVRRECDGQAIKLVQCGHGGSSRCIPVVTLGDHGWTSYAREVGCRLRRSDDPVTGERVLRVAPFLPPVLAGPVARI